MKVTKITTVREIMEYWLLTNERPKLKPTSFDRKVNSIKYQVLPFIGDLPARSLTVEHIDGMVDQLRKKGYSHSTIKKAVEAVSGCYRFLRARRKLTINPTEGFQLGKAPRPGAKIKCYTFEESMLIQHESQRLHENGCPVYPHGDLIIFLLNTGLRIGELLALSWSDVNLTQRTFTVNKNAVRIKQIESSDFSDILGPASWCKYNIIIQDSAKTDASERICPLNQAAYGALLRLAARDGQRGLIAKTTHGTPIHPSNLARTLTRITKNCGFPAEKQLGPHALRHTFATCLLRKGADIKKVSELLGHSSVQVTYDYYVHFIPADYAATVRLLDDPAANL